MNRRGGADNRIGGADNRIGGRHFESAAAGKKALILNADEYIIMCTTWLHSVRLQRKYKVNPICLDVECLYSVHDTNIWNMYLYI